MKNKDRKEYGMLEYNKGCLRILKETIVVCLEM